ncbi:hypothetical protein [Clostridium vitabionis]|uniref:hypothetical protein n=1 Tax=Clostridium vitabionis TaxID=2784388 RepID=UPI00188AC344|nr:hypothetical protein [Clostridium vitabionis]
MKKMSRTLPTAVFSLVLIAGMTACSGGQASVQPETTTPAETTAQTVQKDAGETPLNLNTWLMENSEITTNEWTKQQQRTLKVDRKRVNDHPIEGYMTYTLPSGRTCKMYIGKHSALRAYITVLALPDGVTDTLQFLKDQGWTDLADEYGELIFVLEPQNGKWGSPEDEAGYLNDCLAETVSNDAFGLREKNPGGIVTRGSFQTEDGMMVSAFTGHSCNYYVGYKEGCAPLESWTSANPCYVAGQAFIGGTSAGNDILSSNAARQYNGINTGGYYPGLDDNSFHMELIKLRDEGVISSDSFITNNDIPVPTLFAGYADDDPSVVYWKEVNDTEDTAKDGVYHQKSDSDAWQTEYNNTVVKDLGCSYGISEVKIADNTDMPASEIRDFLSMYTRYTNVFAYSNTLGLRTDYYPVMHKAREAAESGTALDNVAFQSVEGAEKTVEIRALESARLSIPFLDNRNEGDVFSCVTAFNDYDGDGTLDPRECLIYVPDSAKDHADPNGVPVVLICPGSTQASCTFFDCSYWWNIANQKKCAFAILGQFCNSNAASLSYGDQNDSADFCRSTLAIMEGTIAEKEGIKIDPTRVYGSGHSAGCRLIQTLTHTTESGYFAAVGSTSFPNADFSFENGMPSYLSVGQADISEPLPNPFSRDLVKEPWIVTKDSAIYNWVHDCLKDNGIDWAFTADDKESFLATCMDYTETGRYHTYTWADKTSSVPIVRFNRTIAREHNCIPVEFSFAWDFISKYRLQDGKRYYSPSAFTDAGDTVQVDTDKNDIHD